MEVLRKESIKYFEFHLNRIVEIQVMDENHRYSFVYIWETRFEGVPERSYGVSLVSNIPYLCYNMLNLLDLERTYKVEEYSHRPYPDHRYHDIYVELEKILESKSA